jgi:hypothetical protein
MWFPLRTTVGRCGKSLGSGASWSIMFKIRLPLSANNSLGLRRRQKLEFYPTRVEVALCTVFRWSKPRIPQLSKKNKNYGTGICFKSFYAVFVNGHLGGTAVNYAMKI